MSHQCDDAKLPIFRLSAKARTFPLVDDHATIEYGEEVLGLLVLHHPHLEGGGKERRKGIRRWLSGGGWLLG
jgi:hypothetical protein